MNRFISSTYFTQQSLLSVWNDDVDDEDEDEEVSETERYTKEKKYGQILTCVGVCID